MLPRISPSASEPKNSANTTGASKPIGTRITKRTARALRWRPTSQKARMREVARNDLHLPHSPTDTLSLLRYIRRHPVMLQPTEAEKQKELKVKAGIVQSERPRTWTAEAAHLMFLTKQAQQRRQDAELGPRKKPSRQMLEHQSRLHPPKSESATPSTDTGVKD